MKKGSNNEHMNNIIVTTTSVNFSFMACVDGLYPPKIVEGGTGIKFQRISITTRRREAQKKSLSQRCRFCYVHLNSRITSNLENEKVK